MNTFDDPLTCMACKEHPCECCARCGATPDQACEPWCELREDDDVWPEKIDALEVL